MKKLLALLFLFSLCAMSYATHNRAGEITYRHVQGNTYEITITTYTKSSVIADREWLSINWGDNLNPGAVLDSIRRDSILFSTSPSDFQINYYTERHTYPGPGVYTLSVEDPNRNENVNNIPESVSVPFYIESQLVISPLGHNNSVQLLNPALGDACLFSVWFHNPGAFDPDGDSLHFELISCKGLGGEPIENFEFPDENTGNPTDTFTIDPVDGTVTWDVPQLFTGEYNFAFRVKEYRNGFLVGSVTRDMQVTVITCNNRPPEFEAIADTCIGAGQNLSFEVEASDPDGDSFFLQAIGGPMSEVEHPANFNGSTGEFSWTPECEEVRQSSYEVLFKAEDFGNQIALIGVETMFITVVAPAVENPIAEPEMNSIVLNWDVNECITAVDDPSEGAYKIYRRIGLYDFDPSNCELGVPDYTGYELIDEVEGLNTNSYVDTENLNFGSTYCYMIVTCLPDGSVSYASEEFCATVAKEAPIITNVDVVVTGLEDGHNYIAWSPPTAIDTLIFQGPFQYELYFNNETTPVFESTIEPILFGPDTTFEHLNIDTESLENFYRVIFYAFANQGDNRVPITSNTATSVFLELVPNDNQLTLVWDESVPWTNTSYEIFMEDEFGVMESIGTTANQDTTIAGLINNEEYCFMIISTGTFGGEDIIDPVINRSQRVCGKPVDLTPPCPPTLSIDPDCDLGEVNLTWSNPNNDCADDVTAYRVYFAPLEGDPLKPMLSFSGGGSNDTTFTFSLTDDMNSIAGCYAVTALDSLINGPIGLNQNESEFSEILCVDNCPLYFLPNVFTPNGDGVNDIFRPLENRYVESIECTIFNRWGSPVFSTTDPAIDWDGASDDSGDVVSDGVYYFTITANTIRLSGIIPVELTGTITVLDSDNRNIIRE